LLAPEEGFELSRNTSDDEPLLQAGVHRDKAPKLFVEELAATVAKRRNGVALIF